MPTKAPFADLDAMLTPQECAEWLDMTVEAVTRNPRIPKCRIGKKTLRFHPRTILEALHKPGAKSIPYPIRNKKKAA